MACHLINSVYSIPKLNKTSFDVYYNKSPNFAYFLYFWLQMLSIEHERYIGKFYSKANEYILMGYFSYSRV